MDADVDYERRTQHEGKIRGTVYFPDDSRLKFVELVVIEAYKPIKHRYAYQYLRGSRTVFRYDNARGSSTFNRGHVHHLAMRSLVAREGRPRRLGGDHGGGGT